MYKFVNRNYNRFDDDHNQHGRQKFVAQDQLREGNRHLSSDVFRVRVRRPVGIRSRQLHILGRTCQEKEQEDQRGGREQDRCVRPIN